MALFRRKLSRPAITDPNAVLDLEGGKRLRNEAGRYTGVGFRDRRLESGRGRMKVIFFGRNESRHGLGGFSSAVLEVDFFFSIFFPPKSSGFEMALRADDTLATLAPSIAGVVQRIDPRVRSASMTFDDSLNRFLIQERTVSEVASSFGICALILACVGLYGLLAYNVTLRTREIGVRIALGATGWNIVSLVLKQAMGLSAVGCAAGVISAIALVHFIASRLYGITSTDPLTFLATGGLLGLAALVACRLPAHRATRVDPMIALRSE